MKWNRISLPLGWALGDRQLGEPVARRNSGARGLLAIRVVHSLQGGFAPLSKRFPQMRAVVAPVLPHGVPAHRFRAADLQRLAQLQTRFEEELPLRQF